MAIMYPEIAEAILNTLFEEGLEMSDAADEPLPGDCAATLEEIMTTVPYKKNVLSTLLDMAEAGLVDVEEDESTGEAKMTWFLTKEGLKKAMNS